MTSQYGSVQSNSQVHSGFKPGLTNRQLQPVPDWSEIPPLKWLESISQLATNSIDPEQRLYWMLTFRDWIEVNLVETKLQDGKITLGFSDPAWNSQLIAQYLKIMSQVAYNLCDWPMMIKLYELSQLLTQRQTEQSPDHSQMVEYLQLAVAYWQMGLLNEAEEFLTQKLPLFEQETPLVGLYQQVKYDIEHTPFIRSPDEQDELLLMPLEEQHLSGFSWVYHDPKIAQLCNLPTFADDEQWYNWLAVDQMNEHKQVFAVLHQQWGFIGSVSIEVHDGVGFCYYWLGQDFQGGGLGPQAVDLLLDLAAQYMDMDCCYAKVFIDNKASQKALNKLGFVPVPFKIAAPHDDQEYYYRGEQKELKPWGEELVKLAAITDIDNTILI